jgi:ribosomal protein S18 acetylase RimI-like enzyme
MVTLIPNSEEHWEFIRNLRNDPKVKDGFVNQDHITVEQQVEYMKKYNDNYYLCLDIEREEVVGYIGQIDGDIRLAVSPDKQGLGYGRLMLEMFMKLHPFAHAKVKLGNFRSMDLFERNGFSVHSVDENFYYYHYDL